MSKIAADHEEVADPSQPHQPTQDHKGNSIGRHMPEAEVEERRKKNAPLRARLSRLYAIAV